jgi:hypothetical protein
MYSYKLISVVFGWKLVQNFSEENFSDEMDLYKIGPECIIYTGWQGIVADVVFFPPNFDACRKFSCTAQQMKTRAKK